MSLTATTVNAAVGARDTSISVASATGFNNPQFQAGAIPGSGGSAPYNVVQVDMEQMRVESVSGTVIGVTRGFNGTSQVAHSSGAPAFVGLPSDFPYAEIINKMFVPGLETNGPVQLTATNLSGSADALTGVAGRYVIKTAGVDAITLAAPNASMEGNLIEIWSDTANAHTITCPSAIIKAGEAAKTVITFPAFAGAGCVLRVVGVTYHLVGSGPGGNATAATGGTPIGALVLS